MGLTRRRGKEREGEGGAENLKFVRLETKSCRVLGVSLHPKRPWILAALERGGIQLWDYNTGALIETFDERRGPVRSVHFHPVRQIFVSGGNDGIIKVWDCVLRRCVFTLDGHEGYIRTVQFHHVLPWIVSASDDHTIRIWNWESRACLSVLEGHTKSVRSASFHPKDDNLVVSASMDQTVKVWDFGVLRKKFVSPPADADDKHGLWSQLTGLSSGADVVVKHELRGHGRGVKWASFHPTQPLIYSAADDRQVKIWKMHDNEAWEVNRLTGHYNNVSCVLFHLRQCIIVSSSEDKSIRVWDATKSEDECIMTSRREHDKFWVLSSHPDPESNTLAAGHDSGLIVFKLQRDRPAFSVSDDLLLYVNDCWVRVFEYSTEKDLDIKMNPIERHSLSQGRRTLSHVEKALLICSEGSYELHVGPGGYSRYYAKRGSEEGSAVFVTGSEFAVLQKSNSEVITVKNMAMETLRSIPFNTSVDAIFPARFGCLLLKLEDRVAICDMRDGRKLGELQIPPVRYVVWSSGKETVALLSKHSVVIADYELELCCTVQETIRVKSGAFDDNGVFIYATATHIKYCLPNGDNGIIRSLEAPIYITKIFNDGDVKKIYFLDRNGKIRSTIIDSTEYVFKLSVLRKNDDQVKSMIENPKLCCQAMVAYLLQRGFPEVAMLLVKDERIRFDLALKVGNLEIALKSAEEIDEKDQWNRLGVEAFWLGKTGIAERAFMKAENSQSASFNLGPFICEVCSSIQPSAENLEAHMKGVHL